MQYHPVTDQLLHFDFLRVLETTKVNVEIPVGISRKQEDLFKQIKDLGVDKISPKASKFKKLI